MITFDAAAMVTALHRLKEGQPLSFAVVSVGAADPVETTKVVGHAVGKANLLAAERIPIDPTWCNDPMPSAKNAVVSEMAKGTFADDEVLAWFTDFTNALGDLNAKVEPRRPPRVPNLESWIGSEPRSLTAYLDFLPPDPDQWTRYITPAVREASEGLAAWATLPGATTVISRAATTEFVVPAASAGDALALSFEIDPQHSIESVISRPRRGRIARFGFRAKAELQVIDENRSPAACLAEVLEGVRLLTAYLVQARVRLGANVIPQEQDVIYVYGREPTEAEQAATDPHYLHLLPEYVVDAYVAQVLTNIHLDKIGHPDGFTVEPLGHDRYLVVAEDPEPWLAGPSRDLDVLEAARRQFAPAQLTSEVIRNNRRARP